MAEEMGHAAGDELLDHLAGAILDGTPIDWAAAELSAQDPARRLVRQLRLLATVAEVHRGPPATDSTLSWVPPARVAAASPEQWGHLRILEPIGRGTFGRVYRAWDTRLDREVALKLLPAPHESDDRGQSSIIHEGRLQARVRHPNVVTIYGAEQIGDQIGLWMECVRGHTLEQLIQQGTIFGADQVAEIGVELCRAVSAVHGAGLLHRDIKAHNVTRAEDGRVVLMDFGTGREVDDSSASDLTGTPLYLAPEVLRGESATVRSDIYSLGVLLYHLVTRSYPFRAGKLGEMRLAHERNDRVALRTARPDLPPALAGAIERAIDLRPERRQESADALAADLATHLRRQTLVAARARGRWTNRLTLTVALVLIGLAATDARGYFRARPALDSQASLLVATFTGASADREVVATLQQVATTELEGSPFLNVLPASRVRESLERMKRQSTSLVDEVLGLEICGREGVAAMLTGSVEALDGLYIVRLQVIHAGSRTVLANRQEGRRSREDMLEATMAMARRLRQQLGESLASVQATSPPLEPVTSRSFEAVRHFTLGKQLYDVERAREALPHFLNAIDMDPDFAVAHEYAGLAYGYLGEYERKGQSLDTAAALASNPSSPVGTIEREKILANRDVHLERFDEAAAHWRALVNLRPADGRALANLGMVYGYLRQYPESIDALEAALRAYPHPRVRWMLADMYSSAGRPEDAIRLLHPHLNTPLDWIAYACHLMVGDQSADVEAALKEAEQRSHQSHHGASWADLALAQSDFYRSEGRYRDAEDALQQGLDRGGAGGLERLELAMVSLLVDWGRPGEAAARLGRIDIQLARNRIVHGVLAARAGDLTTAAAILGRLEHEAKDRRAPRPEARVHQLRAEIALAKGRGLEAREHAGRAVRAFQTAWTLETLARAQTASGNLPEAITTWTSVLVRRGERAVNDWDAPAYSQVVRAEYELGRLLERAGRLDEARARYDHFLRRWDRADSDLTLLVEVRDRRSRLGHGAQSTPSGRVPKPAA